MSHLHSLLAGTPTCSQMGKLDDFNVGWLRVSS
jgi:hypothetical protein